MNSQDPLKLSVEQIIAALRAKQIIPKDADIEREIEEVLKQLTQPGA